MQNFNGQEPYVNHEISYRRDADKAAESQPKLDAKRFKRVLKARSSRPLILPLKFNFTVGGRVNPYTVPSDRLEWPIDILGASHNFPSSSFDLNVRRGGGSRYLASLDPDTQVQAKADDFAQTGETDGPLWYSSPMPVERYQQIYLDVYKPVNTGVAESRFVVLHGQRTFKSDDSEGKIDSETQAAIKDLIKVRRVPEPRVLVMAVNFKNGGVAAGDVARDMQTNDAEEPLMIRAIRVNGLRYSTFRIGIRGEDYWMPREAPVWSLAAIRGLYKFGNWMFLKNPVYLPQGMALVADFTNSGAEENPAHFDTPDLATNNRPTLTCWAETV